MEMMQQALWPGVFVSSGIERSFKVNLDCTPKTITQASSDALSTRQFPMGLEKVQLMRDNRTRPPTSWPS